MTVNDMPISCPFVVISKDDTILHVFDGTESGDIAPDVAIRSVINISTKGNYLVLTVD
jgi:hypothetical protein